MASGDTAFDFTEVTMSLVLKILLPVIIGLSLHRLWGSFARKHGRWLALFDKGIILLIVYKSFAKSFAAGLFKQIGWAELLLIALCVSVLFALVYFILNKLALWLGFSIEDRITAVFCGSKKSLVHGTVMSKVLFENAAAQGLFLLPIMMYHALQLIIISVIAQRFARQSKG